MSSRQEYTVYYTLDQYRVLIRNNMASRTALLVIDMQKFFEPMTTTALPNIQTLISHFKSIAAPIIFTQHGHSVEELSAHPSPNQLVRKWGPLGSIAKYSDDWQLMEEIEKAAAPPKDQLWPKIVAKNTYDGFINTNLSQILDEAKVERVVVCGVMTDCCCDTTARSAFNRGYDAWLVSDACGSANSTQHKAGLKAFEFAFGPVLTTREAIDDLKNERSNV